MRNFLKTKWLAVALLLCAPIATWAGDEEVTPVTLQPEEPSFDASNEFTLGGGESAEITGAGNYKITGTNSEVSTDSIYFNLGTLTTETEISLFLHDVKIDTSTLGDDRPCGLYIPASTAENPLTVIIYLYGNNIINGSTYGIYVGENTTVRIHPSGTDGEFDADSETLTITADYGIYNLGKKLTFRAVSNTSENEQNNNLWGTQTINATYVGIYSPCGLDLDNTYMYIYCSGTGVVNVETPTASTVAPGYTIETLVCGIYVDGGMNDGTNILNITMIDLTIVAKNGDTYGIFDDLTTGSGGSVYFGYGKIDITATRCVLHHEGKWQYYTKSEKNLTLIVRGPYCSHFDYYYDGAYYWTCDDGEFIDYKSTLSYVIVDGVDYPLISATSAYTGLGEVDYIDRPLISGWNTICLPYKYNLYRSDTEEVNADYNEYEARQVISAYADFGTIEKTTDGSGKVTAITFTEHSTTSLTEDTYLYPDRAYLVYVDPSYENLGDDHKVTVMFTSQSVDLEVVSNDADGSTYDTTDGGETLLTVFKTENMTSADDGGTHYKLISREETDPEDNSKTVINNYFNLPSIDMDIPAYRAYIDGEAAGLTSEQTVSIKSITAVEEDVDDSIIDVDSTEENEITGISTVSSANGTDVIYNVQGIRLSDMSNKGLYIVNGKKVIVK